MPIYEYECSDCGRRLERLQRLDDPPPGACECGGAMHRQVSAPAFQFKGSGWYVTDYGGRKSATDGDSEAPQDSDKSEKPAADKTAGKADNAPKKAVSAKPGTTGDTG
jgi:putative FmdB family regulatory protein